MKYFYSILCGVLLAFSSILADEAFPVSYSIQEVINNGKILKADNQYSYILKKSFADVESVLHIKNENSKNSLQIVQLSNIKKILNSAIFNSGLFIVYPENEKIYAEYIDTNGFRKSRIMFADLVASNPMKFVIIEQKADCMLALVDRNLYELCIRHDEITIEKIAEEVSSAKYLDGKQGIVYVSLNQSGANLYYVNDKFETQIISKLSAYENVRLWAYGDTVVVASGSEFAKSTLMQSITLNHGIISESWIETNYEHLQVSKDNGELIAVYLKNAGNYFLQKQKLLTGKLIFSQEINEKLIEPYLVQEYNNQVYAIFRNGLTVFDPNGNISSSDFLPIGEYIKEGMTIEFDKNKLLISSDDLTLILTPIDNRLWFVDKYYQQIGRLAIPILLTIALIVLFQLYRRQKRMLDLLQEQSVRGVIYHLDKSGKMLRANESGKGLLSITASVPKRKNFAYYCINPSLDQLKEFVVNALNSRDSIHQKILINTGADAREWIFSVLPIHNIAGRFRGLVITGIDISEELEKKRLSNWASLAHDMQTNLSTIRLNAEQLKIENDDENYLRKTKIIHQVNVLIHRVRDIVTVGRTNSLDKQFYDSSDICKEVVSEFDSALFPNVVFQIETSSIKVLCDKPKMVRALRNAVENGIRSLKGNQGTIKLSNSSDYKNVYFKIKDSGVGMDEKTKEKMLTPYFTTGAKVGGFGIGTMIMQHVAELHGGEIIINSETNKGTELIFSIPNYSATMNKKTNTNKLFVRKKVT